ncbi:MAG: toxin-antitoxin system HicB family antitoxin [Acidobacteria bacterium]|nr:toxin-antitoxin system HicB family antitoxin [Acidobacteriota bacterium]
MTLRLPETLKSIIDAAAQDAGVSANTWLLQQISRSANPSRRTQGGRRMTGYGRS